jgi:hypothetical protein
VYNTQELLDKANKQNTQKLTEARECIDFLTDYIGSHDHKDHIVKEKLVYAKAK